MIRVEKSPERSPGFGSAHTDKYLSTTCFPSALTQEGTNRGRRKKNQIARRPHPPLISPGPVAVRRIPTTRSTVTYCRYHKSRVSDKQVQPFLLPV
ncbi:hypothetical protein VPH35_087350 [Triticum aestivum]